MPMHVALPRLAFPRIVLAMSLLAVACQKQIPVADTTAPLPEDPGVNVGAGPVVTLTLDREAYAPGSDVRMTLRNPTQHDYGYNPCTRVVERESGTSWSAVPEPDRVCTMELRMLARGETVVTGTDLPRVEPGRYRIALRLTEDSPSGREPVRAVSAPFSIR